MTASPSPPGMRSSRPYSLRSRRKIVTIRCMTEQAPAPSSLYAAAIIGGASAGAEVAQQLAERGLTVVIFEQNPRPYGKIEDGLPRWHKAQREKEYAGIAAKLNHENVHYVPNTKIGRDVDFPALARDWGFNAVILACGAWGDRPLAVEGAEAFVDKGLVYQNPFIHWFNHYHESSYTGPRYEVPDGSICVGGGLASIDVIKILMLEVTRDALAKRGIEVDLLEMEHKGIPKTLAAHDLEWEDLGLQGCTLVYRRRIEDMPVMSMPEGADEAKRAKVEQTRARMFQKAQDKYLFDIKTLATPDAILEEDGRLAGLLLRRTRVEGGSVKNTDETFEVETRFVVSSIGSVPEPIPGIAMKGELFDFVDWNLGKLADFPSVFGAGNVVTGKGNIIASRKHATQIAEHTLEAFLGIVDGAHRGEEAIPEDLAKAVGESAKDLADRIESQRALSEETLAGILRRVAERQGEVGYGGDFESWIKENAPGE